MVIELEAMTVNHEGFDFGLFRVERFHASGLAEKKAQLVNRLKLLFERFVGVNGEIGRNDRKL